MMASTGSTTARGYGADHQKERARVKRDLVDPGIAYCWRCGGWINPALRDQYGREMWDLGHDDHDRSVYRGPEHRGRECPASGNRATNGRRVTKLQRWNL